MIYLMKQTAFLLTQISKNLIYRRDGLAAIEFAIIAPIMMLCIFGILCFGMYFGAVHGVQQLVAEAARASIPGLDNIDRKALASNTIKKDAGSYPFLSLEKLSVTSVDTDPVTDAFTVTLQYDASSLPIFSLPYVPLPPKVIARSATIQRGGF